MGAVDPLKCPSSDSLTWSESFKFNPNYVNISCFNIIFYLPLAESYTQHFHITTFVALIAGKVKYTLTFLITSSNIPSLCVLLHLISFIKI